MNHIQKNEEQIKAIEAKEKEKLYSDNLLNCYEVIYTRQNESKERTIYVVASNVNYVVTYYQDISSIRKLGKGTVLGY